MAFMVNLFQSFPQEEEFPVKLLWLNFPRTVEIIPIALWWNYSANLRTQFSHDETIVNRSKCTHCTCLRLFVWQLCVRHPIIVWIMISFDISPRDLLRWNAPKAVWSRWSMKLFSKNFFLLFSITRNNLRWNLFIASSPQFRKIVYEVKKDFRSKFSTVFNEKMTQTRSKRDSFAFLSSIMYFTFLNNSWTFMLRISCVKNAVVCPRQTKNIFYSNSSEKVQQFSLQRSSCEVCGLEL